MFYDGINWPFHILFMSFFTGAAILFWYLDRKRCSDFNYAARSLYLSHFDPPSEDRVGELLGRASFFLERPGVVHDYVAGVYRKQKAQVFNYTYKKSRDPEMAEIFAVVHLRLVDPLPFDLRVAPLESSRKPLPGHDLVFTQADQFHERYVLRSRTPRVARALITSKVVQFFAARDDFILEVAERDFLLMVCHPLQPADLQVSLDRAFFLLGLLAANLVLDH